MKTIQRISAHILVLVLAAGVACSALPKTTPSPVETQVRSANVPELPFDDNPDPTQCGIPVKWGKDDPAWLSGFYDGELIQPDVFLYDSHLRYEVTGSARHGSSVRIVLFQQNPVLDYYQVEVIDTDPIVRGWVPAPFISFDPPE